MFRKISFIDVKNTDRYLFKLLGDKAEIYKTELLRTHPFPEFDKEYFITESVCWNTLAKEGYKIRWYNVPVYICEYRPDGLTCSGANRFEGHKENYRGYCYQVECSLRQCRCYEAVTFLENIIIRHGIWEKIWNKERKILDYQEFRILHIWSNCHSYILFVW